MGVLGEEEREAAFFFSGPSPPEDLIVYVREVNMTGTQSFHPCKVKPCVSVADPLGSRKRSRRSDII